MSKVRCRLLLEESRSEEVHISGITFTAADDISLLDIDSVTEEMDWMKFECIQGKALH